MAPKPVSKSAQMRRDVLAAIADRGERGFTCDELEVSLGMLHETASARIWELSHAGAIEPTGAMRPTRRGNAATVWRATGKPIGKIPRRSGRRFFLIAAAEDSDVRAVISVPANMDIDAVRARVERDGFVLRPVDVKSAATEQAALDLVDKLLEFKLNFGDD